MNSTGIIVPIRIMCDISTRVKLKFVCRNWEVEWHLLERYCLRGIIHVSKLRAPPKDNCLKKLKRTDPFIFYKGFKNRELEVDSKSISFFENYCEILYVLGLQNVATASSSYDPDISVAM